MKVIIAGSRSITDYLVLVQVMGWANKDGLWANEVVSGGARGVDKLGERLAKDYNWKLTVFPADWDRHGKKAGIMRNIEMGNYADWLLAIWDGQSVGTKHMISYMKSINKPVLTYVFPNSQ